MAIKAVRFRSPTGDPLARCLPRRGGGIVRVKNAK
jgi:hypothetical protein